MADPQVILDAAFPQAQEGQSVLDDASGDYWLLESGIWRNIGPVLGETINIEHDILPWEETQTLELSVYPSIKVESFPFSFVPVVTEVPLTTGLSFDGYFVYGIKIETTPIIEISAPVPARVDETIVFVAITPIAVVSLSPEIFSSITLAGASSIAIEAFAPLVQSFQELFYRQISIVAHQAYLLRSIIIPFATITITPFEPTDIGSSITPNITQVLIEAFAPWVGDSIELKTVWIFALPPTTNSRSIFIDDPIVVQIIKAQNITLSSLLIVQGGTITIAAFSPTVETFAAIDPDAHWTMWHYTWDDTIFVNNNVQNVPGVNIYAYLKLLNASAVTGGARNTTQKKFGTYSGYWPPAQTSTVVNRLEVLEIDQGQYPWLGEYGQGLDFFTNSSFTEEAFDPIGNFKWTADTSRWQDFSLEFWIYPDSASFKGNGAINQVPLLTNDLVKYNSNTGTFHGAKMNLYRGWEIYMEGTTGGANITARWHNSASVSTTLIPNISTTNTVSVVPNNWYHVVFARSGNHIGLAVNGVWSPIINSGIGPTNQNSGGGQWTGSHPFTSMTDKDFFGAGGEMNWNTATLTRYAHVNIGTFYWTGEVTTWNSSPVVEITAFDGINNKYAGYMDNIRLRKGPKLVYASGTTGGWSNFTPPTTTFQPTLENRSVDTDNFYFYPETNTQPSQTYTVVSSFYERQMWDWFYRVEDKEDFQELEVDVKIAVNKFILRLQKDGLWASITDCYLFMGARTFNGAINVQLKGSPANEWHAANSVATNFGAADYNRELGLRGDGVTKFIRTDRVANSFSSINHHRAAWITQVGTGPIFSSGYSQAGATYVDWIPGYGGIRHGFNNNVLQVDGEDAINSTGGFVGFSRSNANNYQYLLPGAAGTRTAAAQAPYLEPVEILTASVDQNSNWQRISYGSHRMCFYSHGASLNLNQYKMRVQMLMNEIASAIP